MVLGADKESAGQKRTAIGSAIRQLREQREWTLRELAEKMRAVTGEGGWSFTNLSAKETGRIGVKPNERRAFARVFGMTVDEFDRKWRPVPTSGEVRPTEGIPVINRAPAGRILDYDHAFSCGEASTSREYHEYIDRGGIDDDMAYGLVVVGDAMSPTLKAGDYLIFAPVEVAGRVRYTVKDGDCVFVRLGPGAKNPGVAVGRYARGRTPSHFDVRMDNKKYPPIRVSKEHVTEMGVFLQMRRSEL